MARMARVECYSATVIFGLLAPVVISGCGPTRVPEPPGSVLQLKAIARAYARATEELDHPPNNKEELMLYLKEDVAKLYDNPADALRSKVDGEEFVVHYGVDFRNVTGKIEDLPVLAYEKTGKDGKRAVLQFRYVTLKTDEELGNLKFPAPYKSPV